MNRRSSYSGPQRQFSSSRIVLLFGGALATSVALDWFEREDDTPPPPLPAPQALVYSQADLSRDLQSGREEENNSYVPGLGYYHALHHSWFPYPFDYYYPGYGYYRGGAWFTHAFSGANIPARSKPHWYTVTEDRPAASNLSSGSPQHSGGGFRSSSSHEGGVSRGGFTAPHSSGFHPSFGGHFGGS